MEKMLKVNDNDDKYIVEYKRIENEFEQSIKMIDDVILKKYISNLNSLVPLNKKYDLKETVRNIRMYKINKMVYEKNEFSTYKFINLFNSLSYIKTSVFLMIESNQESIDIYLGIKNLDSERVPVSVGKLLLKSFEGQFAGAELSNQNEEEIEKILNNKTGKFVSSVTGIANLIDNENKKNETFVQGLEKLIQSMKGQKYRAIILAENKTSEDLNEIRGTYESIYSNLSSFSELQINFSENDSINYGDSISKSKSIGETITTGTSTTEGNSYSENESKSLNKSESKKDILGVAASVAGGILSTVGVGLALTGVGAPLAIGVGALGGALVGASSGAKTYTKGESFTTGSSYTENNSTTKSESTSNTNTDTDTKTISSGKNTGKGKAITLVSQNKTIKNILDRIDTQLNRIKEFETFGMWECAAYFISDDPQTPEIAGSIYKSIIQGNESGVETSAINSWDKEKSEEIIRSITNFEHPSFKYINDTLVKATSYVSSKELGIQMALPKKSVVGFPVIEHTQYAQEVIKYNECNKGKNIEIGKVYNMGKETDTVIKLDKESLSMHTFITGTTGSGKSNTIYGILNELNKTGIKFMVIEPAKGEYKNIFGNRSDVRVLGSNPKLTELLKINPFRFPKEIHILEHVDRLIEIFNVCWSMYAAMPAILKEATLKAYENCGWDLIESENKISDKIFPTFYDLQNELRDVIQTSAYSDEMKGNYIGALLTRVKSLTNGLNGQIFSNDEIDNKKLFDENVIVDLSRVSSLETKSLIMGILIMRLNEYRMSEAKEMNSELKHITVLEEAHNILKKISTEQNMEGSNIAGKSVEMLSNAISEMRTYGEGFIIADQSPNAVDISAIRNTNTKIIMRLSDELDRRLIGKSVGLKDEQLNEISKLSKGVAVVYQNDWIEAVLCKIKKCENKEEKYNYTAKEIEKIDNIRLKQELLNLLLISKVNHKITPNIEYIENNLFRGDLLSKDKKIFQELLEEYTKNKKLEIWEVKNFEKFSRLITSIVIDKIELIKMIGSKQNFSELQKDLMELIEKKIKIENEDIKIAILHSLMKDFSIEGKNNLEIYSAWRELVKKGEI